MSISSIKPFVWFRWNITMGVKSSLVNFSLDLLVKYNLYLTWSWNQTISMFSIMAIIPQIGNLKTFQSRKNCPTKNVYIPIVLDLVFNYVFVFNNVFISYLFLINFLKRLVYLVTLVITSILFCYKCAAEDGQKT